VLGLVVSLRLQREDYIVIIVGEMADLMMVAGKDIEGAGGCPERCVSRFL
jgi:hypothetical protein